MAKPTDEVKNFINQAIAAIAEKNPERCTIKCTECGELYVAKDLADLFVCQHCGKTQRDDEVREGGENGSDSG
ncbi:MAG: hypothetical protein NTX82_04110 [Candidatus Parcubacteria bacterium]|nr:hypothetical protein [Candidatus Parcubacteria bacterium]